MVAEGRSWPRAADFQGVDAGRPPAPLLDGPLLILTPATAELDGMAIPASEESLGLKGELGTLLRAKAELQRQLRGEEGVVAVVLEIDGRVPWEQVAAVYATLTTLPFDRVELAFDAKSALRAPAPTPVSDTVRRLAGISDRLDVALAPPSESSPLRGCKTKVDLSAKQSLNDNLEKLAQLLPRCGCDQIDVAEVEEWVWYALSRHHGPVHASVTLPLPRSGVEATPLSRPASEPWALASKAVVAAVAQSGRLSFVVTGTVTAAPPQGDR